MPILLLTWNVRGFGRREKWASAANFKRKNGPNVVCFQETKLEEVPASFQRKIRNAGNCKMAYAPAVGTAGGLITLWDEDFFQASNVLISGRYIAIIGNIIRHKFSNFLKSDDIPWCIGGDFNFFLNPTEKVGMSFNGAQINMFRTFISDAGLVDLPMSDGSFTWSNNRDSPSLVHLDRFLLSSNFLLKFPSLFQ
ncbi:hypothetical protein V6N13_042477 [Hibiscus sabdariffa]|uniref:Endonuclease/exonuclease/phosphatase domain-containing protein n=1 Tax=Hibiscus sabdariffa TaxID=183260 RepID=A0ABR2G4U7_9ROSI